MSATTNEKFCPSLCEEVESDIPADVKGIYEIVIDGVGEDAIKKAMKVGIAAAVKVPGVKRIYAGNYGGTLGAYQIWLKDMI